MKQKLQDRFLEALIAKGEVVVKPLSRCIVVSCRTGGYYYLGKGGSLRRGMTRQGSIRCSAKAREFLLNGDRR